MRGKEDTITNSFEQSPCKDKENVQPKSKASVENGHYRKKILNDYNFNSIEPVVGKLAVPNNIERNKNFITKDGKVVGHKIATPPGKMPTKAGDAVSPGMGQAAPRVTPADSAPSPASPATPVQQKVQVIKSADGKIQVRGLLPGQRLVQMPDGRLKVFSKQQTGAATK